MRSPVILDWNNKLFRYLVDVEDDAQTFAEYDEYNFKYFVRMDQDFPDLPSVIQFVHPWHNLEKYNNLMVDTPEDLHTTDPEPGDPLYPSKYGSPDYYHDRFDPTELMPENPKLRRIRLNIPLHNVETYQNTDYALIMSTWIAGTEVVLGNYLITHENRLARIPMMTLGERYMEQVEFLMLDPWSIIYDDEWKEWRQNICMEKPNINNTGSSLNISLWPIQWDEESKYYNIIEGGNIASSNLVINDNHDVVSGSLKIDDNDYNVRFNLIYNSIYTDILEYISETYLENIEDPHITYSLSIQDDEDMYFMEEYTPEFPVTPEDFTGHMEYSFVVNKEEFKIKDWSEFENGVYLRGIIDIKDGDEIVMSIPCNDVPVLPETYKFWIQTPIDSIELNRVDMHQYIVNVVNKINKTVVQVDNAKEYKSKIIKPVFFQSRSIDNVIIHPEVTENVSIKLNQYKSKTEFFYVKVEGVVFPEIGRNHTGVIFKIQGNLLPRAVEEGMIYVLNQDKELITTGNFKYIS